MTKRETLAPTWERFIADLVDITEQMSRERSDFTEDDLPDLLLQIKKRGHSKRTGAEILRDLAEAKARHFAAIEPGGEA